MIPDTWNVLLCAVALLGLAALSPFFFFNNGSIALLPRRATRPELHTQDFFDTQEERLLAASAAFERGTLRPLASAVSPSQTCPAILSHIEPQAQVDAALTAAASADAVRAEPESTATATLEAAAVSC